MLDKLDDDVDDAGEKMNFVMSKLGKLLKTRGKRGHARNTILWSARNAEQQRSRAFCCATVLGVLPTYR